jgi:hypothetical protein
VVIQIKQASRKASATPRFFRVVFFGALLFFAAFSVSGVGGCLASMKIFD